jgi:hypothetical protein
VQAAPLLERDSAQLRAQALALALLVQVLVWAVQVSAQVLLRLP